MIAELTRGTVVRDQSDATEGDSVLVLVPDMSWTRYINAAVAQLRAEGHEIRRAGCRGT